MAGHSRQFQHVDELFTQTGGRLMAGVVEMQVLNTKAFAHLSEAKTNRLARYVDHIVVAFLIRAQQLDDLRGSVAQGHRPALTVFGVIELYVTVGLMKVPHLDGGQLAKAHGGLNGE